MTREEFEGLLINTENLEYSVSPFADGKFISIRNYIAELSKDKIILFATHVVSDIECIADQVFLLKSGEIIATGTPVKLTEQMQGKVGEMTCTLDDVAQLQGKYHIDNIKQRKEGLVLRLVGDEPPEEAVLVDNNIEFMYE